MIERVLRRKVGRAGHRRAEKLRLRLSAVGQDMLEDRARARRLAQNCDLAGITSESGNLYRSRQYQQLRQEE